MRQSNVVKSQSRHRRMYYASSRIFFYGLRINLTRIQILGRIIFTFVMNGKIGMPNVSMWWQCHTTLSKARVRNNQRVLRRMLTVLVQCVAFIAPLGLAFEAVRGAGDNAP